MIEVNFDFDDLEKAFAEAERAARELEGQLRGLKFNPADPTDVDLAIREMERMVEQKFRSNPIIQAFTDAVKEEFRVEIIKQASEARKGES
jgi:hypothetical protein